LNDDERIMRDHESTKSIDLPKDAIKDDKWMKQSISFRAIQNYIVIRKKMSVLGGFLGLDLENMNFSENEKWFWTGGKDWKLLVEYRILKEIRRHDGVFKNLLNRMLELANSKRIFCCKPFFCLEKKKTFVVCLIKFIEFLRIFFSKQDHSYQTWKLWKKESQSQDSSVWDFWLLVWCKNSNHA